MDTFTSAYDDNNNDDDDLPPFFIPTYLRSSRHLLRLRQAHDRRQREQRELRELARSNAVKSLSTHSSTTNLTKLPHSTTTNTTTTTTTNTHHYSSNPALSDTIHERLPPPSLLDENDTTLHPLPSRWNPLDSQSGLEILAQGSEIRFAGILKTNNDDAASVRSDYPMPKECGIYYFEVTILSRHKDSLIGIGFSSQKAHLNRLPGWENESWAYHGDDGHVFACTASGKPYGPAFSREDVVGCGVDFRRGEAFFTRNGAFLGTAFTGVKGDKLFPSVGMKKPNEHVRVNFGQKPFVFDIDGMVERERRGVLEAIRGVDVKGLHPPDDEGELVKGLVGQYLAHEGYVETKRMFSREVRERERESRHDGGEVHHEEEEEDDVHAVNRQKIRKAILEGDIDRALKFTQSYYPRVLEEERNRDVWLRLRCRKFVEMIRRAGEIKRGEVEGVVFGKKPDNGGGGGGGGGVDIDDDDEEEEDTQMELDNQLHPSSIDDETQDRDNDQRMSEEPDSDDDEDDDQISSHKSNSIRASQLEQQALVYGASLQEEFGRNPNSPEAKILGDCFAVLAYEDWRDSPVRGLFEREGRGEIAEGVNGAVLVSLGKPSSAALEKVCAQTEALLDECVDKEGGGAGGMACFVNVQRDFLRED